MLMGVCVICGLRQGMETIAHSNLPDVKNGDPVCGTCMGKSWLDKAKLTPEQVKRYGEVFATVIPKASYREADAAAWQGLCEEWPELAVCNIPLLMEHCPKCFS